MKIRGINVVALQKSGLVPALNTLIHLSKIKSVDALRWHYGFRQFLLLGSLASTIAASGIAVFLPTVGGASSLPIVLLFAAIGVALGAFSLPAYLEIKNFTHTVNKLDALLKSFGSPEGIRELPRNIDALWEKFENTLVKIAQSILPNEAIDPFSKETKEGRKTFAECYRIMEEFGKSYDRRKIFDKAKENLEKIRKTAAEELAMGS